MNYQFCCGEHEIPGWENYDTDCDITKLLPFPNESAEKILCEHGGEHFTAPELFRFLKECHRMLKSGGVMRLCCPVIGEGLSDEHAIDLVVNHGHKQLLTPDILRTFLRLAGFHLIRATGRSEIDGHWKIIGKEKDDLETCRIEGTK